MKGAINPFLPKLKKWSVSIDYTARDDNGKQFRARTLFHVEAKDVPAAYAIASAADWTGYETVKLGFIIPGWHERIP